MDEINRTLLWMRSIGHYCRLDQYDMLFDEINITLLEGPC